jgi:methionyl-tRNA formyltransferase
LRLGFAGTPEFAVPALDALARSRHRVEAVFTQPDRPAGRGQVMHLSAVKRRAGELGLTVHQPQSFKTPDAEATLRGLDLDALVVVAYGLILPIGALAAPKLGCFNIHASLLPRWRGAAPIQRALLAGDATTGISIMRMEAGLDTGPMLATRELAIAPQDTGGSLHDRLAHLGGDLIVDTLDAVANGSTHEEQQPSMGITYADKINKAEALIDWGGDARSILRRVRAFNPWPIAETKLDGVQVRVWEAELGPDTELPTRAGEAASPRAGSPDVGLPEVGSPRAAPLGVASSGIASPGAALIGSALPRPAPGTVLAVSNDGVDVACGQGALRILRLQLAGRKPLAAQEFIKAQRLAGARFTSP